MGKRKIFKIVFAILSIFLCVVFYELLGICVAYKKQPEVSNTTKKETKNGAWNECRRKYSKGTVRYKTQSSRAFFKHALERV